MGIISEVIFINWTNKNSSFMKRNWSEFWQRELKIRRQLVKADYDTQRMKERMLILQVVTILLCVCVIVFVVLSEMNGNTKVK